MRATWTIRERVAAAVTVLVVTVAVAGAGDGSAPERAWAMAAARDLSPGVKITKYDLYAVEIAPDLAPPGVFLEPRSLVGRVPHERILAHEMVRVERLADLEAGIGFNAYVPAGMRAISLSMRDAPRIAAELSHGWIVDVHGTLADGTAGTVLEDLRVLGTHPVYAGRAEPGPSVTLIVTPDQAEEIARAQARGSVRLTVAQGGM